MGKSIIEEGPRGVGFATPPIFSSSALFLAPTLLKQCDYDLKRCGGGRDGVEKEEEEG